MRLTYFAAPARAESCRLMLGVTNTKFKDVRVKREEWQDMKQKVKYSQLPILELDDGRTLAQSAAITRYVAKQTGFYPEDDWHVALSDEMLGLTEDITGTLRPAFMVQVRSLDPDERIAKFKELVETTFADKAKLLEHALTAQSGSYLTGDSATYGDWHVFAYIGQFMSGMFGMPTDIWKGHKQVEQFRLTMAKRKDVQQYYEEEAKQHDEDFMTARRGFMP